MNHQTTFLVFGATGGTGKHFLTLALERGHKVKVLVRNPAKLSIKHRNLMMQQGSINDQVNLDPLLSGVDFVISMLGDREVQKTKTINTFFVQKLVQAMRSNNVKRFLYQAGGLTRSYRGSLPFSLWLIRKTFARQFEGQHKDNEKVIEFLTEEARDIEWMVHRAGIGGDGPSKGQLVRSSSKISIGTHYDCAHYNYRMLMDPLAIHSCDFSHYGKAK